MQPETVSTTTASALQLDALRALAPLREAVQVTIDPVEISSTLDAWPGPFPIDDVAVSAIATALAATAQLAAHRNGTPTPVVRLDARHAAASFASEGFVRPRGWTLPPVWDPIAGDYRTKDGWIRLHTNYVHHRRAALRALGIDDRADLSRQDIESTVQERASEPLESAVVAEGGVAGAFRDAVAWRTHPAGTAINAEPLLHRVAGGSSPSRSRRPSLRPSTLPLDDVRVVDLTRVLAGPTATGFLSAWGADVIRIDPIGFEEVPAIVPITTCGKRTTALDLRAPHDRDRLLALVRDADVVVHGYRNGAMEALGLGADVLHECRPGLIIARLDAYGYTGPWSDRRGFDSIVQHSVGITALGQQVRDADRPVPLPCQALDHGTGWLLAAAVVAALLDRERTGVGSTVAASLARYAALVQSLPCDVDPDRPAVSFDALAPFVATASTAWGPLDRLRWPGAIGDIVPRLGSSGPTGANTATWI